MAKVLLIEDDEDIRLNVAEILTLVNHEVFVATNGREGVDLAKKEHPDIIVSDVMMPLIDGFGVLHVLKKDPATSTIPFIFLTSKSEACNLREAMRLGANDYIIKPFEGSDLLNALETRLKDVSVQPVKELNPNTADISHSLDKAATDPMQELLNNCESAEYGKKQIIYKEGSTPRYLYFIKSGKVRTYKSHEDGKDLVMNLYGKNDFVGYAPLLEGVFQVETAETMEDTELILIPKKDFEKLVEQYPEVTKKFMGLLARNLLEKEEQLLGAAYNTLRKKVASALVSLGRKYKIEQEQNYIIIMSRDELASIAGTATESLIRTLTDFKHERLIDMKNGGIVIIDQHKLQQLLR